MYGKKDYLKRYVPAGAISVARKMANFLDDAFTGWLLVVIVVSLLATSISGCMATGAPSPTILPGDVLSLHPQYTALTVKAAVMGLKPMAEAWYNASANAYLVTWPGPGIGQYSAVCVNAQCPFSNLRGMTMNMPEFQVLMQAAKDSGMYKVVITALPFFSDGVDVRDILIFPILPSTMDMMGKSG